MVSDKERMFICVYSFSTVTNACFQKANYAVVSGEERNEKNWTMLWWAEKNVTRRTQPYCGAEKNVTDERWGAADRRQGNSDNSPEFFFHFFVRLLSRITYLSPEKVKVTQQQDVLPSPSQSAVLWGALGSQRRPVRHDTLVVIRNHWSTPH